MSTLPRLPFRSSLLFALVLGLATAACSLPNRPATKAAATMSKPISNGEVLHFLHTVNEGEIKQAQIALQRSNNPQVQQTAQMIIKDHAASNQRINSLAQSIGVKMDESPLSRGLQLQANKIAEGLAKSSGTELDCNYLQKQVEQHAIVLETVRNQLLPATQHPQVKELLTSAAPVLEQHRVAAQKGRAALGNCPRA